MGKSGNHVFYGNLNGEYSDIVSGDGVYIYDGDGKQYLDAASGVCVVSVGYGNQEIISAISNQIKQISFTYGVVDNIPRQKLAKKLDEWAPSGMGNTKTIFSSSGAEANEGAIKLARKYGKKNLGGAYEVITAVNSFHGRTLAAIFASGSKKMIEGFGPKVQGFDHFEFGNIKSLKKSITKKTAAIMVETVMGEGGIKVISKKFLKEIEKICKKKKILLIFDEIQCGIGRSGKFFAYEYSNVKPDIVPIAKGIGGGFPIGAVLMTKKVSKGMIPGTHGSTFGGNPLAMSVGNAVLDQMYKKNFLKNVNKLSKYFLIELNKIKNEYPKLIKEIRGLGLLIGIQLYEDQTRFIQKLMENNLLTIRAAENVIRILPPLNVKKEEIDIALKIIKKVCLNYK